MSMVITINPQVNVCKIHEGMFMRINLTAVLIMVIYLMMNADSAMSYETDITASTSTQEYVNELVSAKWNKQTAEKVVMLNQTLFDIYAAENPDALKNQFLHLKKLGIYPNLMPLLKKKPELATLLSTVTEPYKFIKSLDIEGECYGVITGLYMQHAAREDSQALAVALENNTDLVCHLIQKGLIGVESLFIFPRENRENSDTSVYEDWLKKALAQQHSPEELASLVNFLFEEGSEIRKRVIRDEKFRNTFSSSWFTLLNQAKVDHLSLEVYFSKDSQLWDFLALPEGKNLLVNWKWYVENIRNEPPSDVLFGKNALAKELHPLFKQSLLEKDELTLTSLLTFGQDILFVSFIKRELNKELQEAAFNKLHNATDYHKLLEDWSKASNQDLHDELLKGAEGTLQTAKKYIQGREVSTFEVFWAAVDTADVIWIVTTLGSGAVLSTTLKQGAKTITKEALTKEASHLIKKEIGQTAATHASQSMLSRFVNRELFIGMQNKLGINTIKNSLENINLDITPGLKLLFNKAGVNRETFKTVTGLEARFFMRRDANVTVVINSPKTMICNVLELSAHIGLAEGINTICLLKDVKLQPVLDKLSKLTFSDAIKINHSAWWMQNRVK